MELVQYTNSKSITNNAYSNNIHQIDFSYASKERWRIDSNNLLDSQKKEDSNTY